METKEKTVPIYPIGRCNNCFWYFHESDQDSADESGKILKCPNCKTSEYIMDMPELAEIDRLKEINAGLLEACKSAFDWLGECEPGTHQAEIADDLKTAIRKAEAPQ